MIDTAISPTFSTDKMTPVKLFGAALLFLCGALYSRSACERAKKELDETDFVISVITRVKNEIADYGAPLGDILKSFGIDGGTEELLLRVSCKSVREALRKLSLIGRGYGKEELRICDEILEQLAELKKSLNEKLKEVTAISRVKGYGVAAATVILLL